MMTFTIPQRSMALNAEGVPPPDYLMWNTYKVPSAHTPAHFIGWAAKVAKDAGGLKCLITNSHGLPGQILLGTGITIGDAAFFSQLKGNVKAIFIVACQVAQLGATPGGRFDGNLLCGAIAQQSGAYVFVSSALQSTGFWGLWGLDMGEMDEFEGVVYRYNPDGSNTVVDNDFVTKYLKGL